VWGVCILNTNVSHLRYTHKRGFILAALRVESWNDHLSLVTKVYATNHQTSREFNGFKERLVLTRRTAQSPQD